MCLPSADYQGERINSQSDEKWRIREAEVRAFMHSNLMKVSKPSLLTHILTGKGNKETEPVLTCFLRGKSAGESHLVTLETRFREKCKCNLSKVDPDTIWIRNTC